MTKLKKILLALSVVALVGGAIWFRLHPESGLALLTFVAGLSGSLGLLPAPQGSIWNGGDYV